RIQSRFDGLPEATPLPARQSVDGTARLIFACLRQLDELFVGYHESARQVALARCLIAPARQRIEPRSGRGIQAPGALDAAQRWCVVARLRPVDEPGAVFPMPRQAAGL